jgi:diguanylate cyclase (GGDEF)-like protein
VLTKAQKDRRAKALGPQPAFCFTQVSSNEFFASSERPYGRAMLTAPNSELASRTLALLEQPSLGISGWRERVLDLEDEFGAEVYPHLIFLLTNLLFPPSSAQAHWERALGTWEEMNASIREGVDLRVALLHYFLEVQRKLQNPTIVEIRILQSVRDRVVRDELTQLYNYRYFRERLQQEARRCQRFNLSLSLLVVDVDDFKSVNDRWGHEQGNQALKQLAQVLKESVREVDVVTRYGGEEFAIVLPATMKSGALVAAEKIRSLVEQTPFHFGEAAPSENLTVSVGLATIPIDAAEPEEVIRKADRALYKAKSVGKNRVEAFSNDRREFTRFPVSLGGRLQLMDKGILPINILNLSQGGFLVSVPQVLSPGCVLQLEMDCPPEDRLSCVAKAVWASELKPGYRVGLKALHFEPRPLYQFRKYLATLEDCAFP